MNKPQISRTRLLMLAHKPLQEFCKRNGIICPEIKVYTKKIWKFDVCAYYRDSIIHICPLKCAKPGLSGRLWSWPGGPIDRTPYGVVQHELGHHVDFIKSYPRYFGDFSKQTYTTVDEPSLTGYGPNPAEWFAEMFRLFITNPDLLRILRPRTYDYLRKNFTPIIEKSWEVVLSNAPERILKMVRNKIKKMEKVRQQLSLL